ncbi:MAG: M20/M25/M40 family metallo-hydrolase [Deltaproteobacteria bacterium]|nr:M20/M25/M40 family metallo-hydrolase [Deltaproteobacteria bacterium]
MRSLYLCAVGAVLGCGQPASSPVELVDRAAYEADVTTIAAPRSPRTPHWQTVQDLCADRFAALGFEVERHTYSTGVNVIGVRMGKTKPAERVVISAHYDSVTSCAGADDNATGVAGTLEAARVLSLQPHDRTLVVACWDEEERGLIGSSAYVARAKAAGDSIVLALVFEMIGYRSSAPMSQRTDPQLEAVFPDAAAQIAANDYRGDFALVVNDETANAAVADLQAVATDVGLPIVNISLLAPLKRSLDSLRRSDHAPFWDAEYPALFVTDTAEYRNPHYHCPRGISDAIADLDFEFAVANVRVIVGTAAKALDR